MWKKRLFALILLIVSFTVGYFTYTSEINKTKPFRLGLDLSGGTHLVYKADMTGVDVGQVNDAMLSLRDVIERRVNLFGVSEPIVQTEVGGTVGGKKEERLIVELPGVTDVKQAIDAIGKTPLLEFRLMSDAIKTEADLKDKTPEEIFLSTGLNGRLLEKAMLDFDQTTGEPKVSIVFNSEGSKLFAKVTKENVGKTLAIFLDGQPISTPTIRTEILGGKAEISGNFKLQEAKTLVRDLNYGALPVPINLISSQTIGASLGEEALKASVYAGIFAFIVIALFLIFWYRLSGIIATVALMIYVILNLAIFKFIPVTLTAAGIAAFILSIGMAVDANILIFERMKEELKKGRSIPDAVREGFHRAWTSIRDSNLSSIITAIILFWFAPTPLIKGFALVFGIGVITSMFTAISASRTLLFALGMNRDSKIARFLLSSGFLNFIKKTE